MDKLTHEYLSVCPICGMSLITAGEAARIIGVSYSRIRAILSHNPKRLQAFRVGKTWVIPEIAAREFQPFPPHRPQKSKGG